MTDKCRSRRVVMRRSQCASEWAMGECVDAHANSCTGTSRWPRVEGRIRRFVPGSDWVPPDSTLRTTPAPPSLDHCRTFQPAAFPMRHAFVSALRAIPSLLFQLLCVLVAVMAFGYLYQEAGGAPGSFEAKFAFSGWAVPAHFFAAALALLLVPLQSNGWVRRRLPALHRLGGWLSAGAILLGGMSGLWLALRRTVGFHGDQFHHPRPAVVVDHGQWHSPCAQPQPGGTSPLDDAMHPIDQCCNHPAPDPGPADGRVRLGVRCGLFSGRLGLLADQPAGVRIVAASERVARAACRYTVGVSPVCRLKAALKVDFEVKPTS